MSVLAARGAETGESEFGGERTDLAVAAPEARAGRLAGMHGSGAAQNRQAVLRLVCGVGFPDAGYARHECKFAVIRRKLSTAEGAGGGSGAGQLCEFAVKFLFGQHAEFYDADHAGFVDDHGKRQGLGGVAQCFG